MSGRKNVILPFKMLDAQTLDSSFNTDPTNIQYLDNVSLQISVTTTANTGQFAIEVSNDPQNERDPSTATWDELDLDPPIAALADADTTISIDMNQLGFTYIRLKFTLGTGTNGTATAYLTAKEL